MCTLRNFPNQIEHCIEWGRDKFNALFVDVPSDAVSYLDNPKLFVHQLKSNNTSSGIKTSLQNMKDFFGYQQSGKFDNCVQLARACFDDYYNYTIMDLLSLFPKDAKDKEGAPFWSGPKRCPSAIPFDVNNKDHMGFIVSYSNLIAAALKIPENRDTAAIAQIVKGVTVPAYVPKKIVVKLPGEEENN